MVLLTKRQQFSNEQRPRHTSILLFCLSSQLAFLRFRRLSNRRLHSAGTRGITHVQIEADGELVFGAYDHFHRETVVVDGIIDTALLDALVKTRTLRAYAPASNRRL